MKKVRRNVTLSVGLGKIWSFTLGLNIFARLFPRETCLSSSLLVLLDSNSEEI